MGDRRNTLHRGWISVNLGHIIPDMPAAGPATTRKPVMNRAKNTVIVPYFSK